MKKIKISGCGYALAKNKVIFGSETRYRLGKTEEFWDMLKEAVDEAMKNAGVVMEDIDCIIGAMATPLQAIPCNAALLHEHIAKGLSIPALDINSSCSSFITALDTVSYYFAGGKYKKVLIISGDISTPTLNPNEKESYSLFSDVCTAVVVEETSEDMGIVFAKQKTWAEGAHHTEIPMGGGLSNAFQMTMENRERYFFTMDGIKVVMLTIEKLIPFMKEFLEEAGLDKEDFKLVLPHQASRILPVVMKKLGFVEGKYINLVADYGNMVSGSVPFTLCKAIESGKLIRGDQIMLMGTAAGLTINLMALKY